jgi:hypothetical protein
VKYVLCNVLMCIVKILEITYVGNVGLFTGVLTCKRFEMLESPLLAISMHVSLNLL